MTAVPSPLDYTTMTRALFLVLFATAPALVFLVQVYLVVPPLFVLALVLYMVPKVLDPAQSVETLAFMGIFGVHLLVFAGFYLNLARGVAKLISLVGNAKLRCALFIIALGAAASVSVLPIYGFGGHSRAAWGPLWLLFEKMNESYGRNSVLVIYGVFSLALVLWILYRKWTARASADGKGPSG